MCGISALEVGMFAGCRVPMPRLVGSPRAFEGMSVLGRRLPHNEAAGVALAVTVAVRMCGISALEVGMFAGCRVPMPRLVGSPRAFECMRVLGRRLFHNIAAGVALAVTVAVRMCRISALLVGMFAGGRMPMSRLVGCPRAFECMSVLGRRLFHNVAAGVALAVSVAVRMRRHIAP